MNSKFMDIVASMAIGESLLQIPIYFLVGSSNILLYLAATVGSAVISGPIIYNIVRKKRAEHEEEDRKRANCVKQTIKGLYEMESESRINQNTSVFFKEIESVLSKESLKLGEVNINIINDLIHLVNVNYYKISDKKTLEREELIERVILQATLYLEKTGKEELKDEDIAIIIRNCFFIEDSVKEEIIKEFKDSAVKFGSFTLHSIENRYFDTEKTQIETKNQKVNFFFDIENIEHYKMVVEGLTANETYLREYGNIDNIEWNYQALKDVFSIMVTKFQSELRKLEPKNGYSTFNLAGSYFYNIMCYAVMNQKAEVDYQSMLATFKDWDYLPYMIKLKMASEIITELNLKDVKHPYLQKAKPTQKTKIIKFSKND